MPSKCPLTALSVCSWQLWPHSGPTDGDTRVRVRAKSTVVMIDQVEMADYTCAFGPERSGDPRSGGPQNDPRSGTALLVKGVHLLLGAMRCVTLPLTKAIAETMGFEVCLSWPWLGLELGLGLG